MQRPRLHRRLELHLSWCETSDSVPRKCHHPCMLAHHSSKVRLLTSALRNVPGPTLCLQTSSKVLVPYCACSTSPPSCRDTGIPDATHDARMQRLDTSAATASTSPTHAATQPSTQASASRQVMRPSGKWDLCCTTRRAVWQSLSTIHGRRRGTTMSCRLGRRRRSGSRGSIILR